LIQQLFAGIVGKTKKARQGNLAALFFMAEGSNTRFSLNQYATLPYWLRSLFLSYPTGIS
jgi:hypothetical protein